MHIRDRIDITLQSWRHRRLPRSHNLVDTAYRLAAEQSAEYQIQHMRSVPDFATDLLLHRAMVRDIEPGVILEFGVNQGRTLRSLARSAPSRQCWGFDSWQGLPQDWTWLFPRGSFSGTVPSFRENNIRLVEGLFQHTLPTWLDQHPDTIRVIHIDSDLYESAAFVLSAVRDRLRPGCRIIFDEYCNYPGWQQDEFRAWQEFVAQHDIEYRYIGRVTRHQQVAVEIVRC